MVYKSSEYEFLLSLPDDPLEAFFLYESRLRDIYLDESSWRDFSDQMDSKSQYISKIIGYVQAHELDVGIPDEIPIDPEDFEKYFNFAQRKIAILVEKLKLQSIQKQKRSVVPLYIISSAVKIEIHHHITQIRALIDESDVTQTKKDRLFTRLNALSLEVDKEKSKGDIALGLYTLVKSDLGVAVGNINEILGHAKGILDAYAKAKEAPLLEITLVKNFSIESPKKQITGPKSHHNFEDDIPF